MLSIVNSIVKIGGAVFFFALSFRFLFDHLKLHIGFFFR
jgi:hypothetical protein